MISMNISVDGIPAAKGNWIAARGIFIPKNKEKLNTWICEVKKTAKAAFATKQPSKGEIWVWIYFRMPGDPKKGACTTRPDIDKLARAILDALSGIIYEDDKQVIWLSAEKRYSENPGADISIIWGEQNVA